MKPDDKIAAAISKVKEKSTRSIQQIMENAKTRGVGELVAACELELKLRGFIDMTQHDVEKMLAATAKVEGKSLGQAIEIAFTDTAANPDEARLLRWISAHPGTSFAATLKAYGRGDLALVIGHLVYERLGYFRPFLETGTMSDVLLSRSTSAGGVCYTLRPETLEALTKLQVV